PLTTFATRLMWTTRSTSSPTSSGLMSIAGPLESKARFAGSVGHFFDAAVIDESVAVEHDLRDLARHQLLADALADLTRALLLRAGQPGLQARLGVARGRDHAAGGVVDRLRVDVLGRPEDRQPRTLRRAVDALADRALALHPLARLLAAEFLVSSHGYFPAVFPALRMIVSVVYLMPLPLYGSGGRKLRISAAS